MATWPVKGLQHREAGGECRFTEVEEGAFRGQWEERFIFLKETVDGTALKTSL